MNSNSFIKKSRALHPVSLHQAVFSLKLNHPVVYIPVLLISIAFGWLMASAGIVSGVIILAVLIAIPLIAAILLNARIGVLIVIVAANLIMWVLRMNITSLPLGTIMDGMEAILIISFFINQRKEKNWVVFKNPITLVILAWIIYNFIEVINPAASSTLAWLYTIRTTALVMVMYFIFLYNIRTVQFIRTIIKLWLFISVFAALYAFKQEYFGFFKFEELELNSDPIFYNLLFIGGHWRKFSIFSDPVTFSYNMVASSIMCIVLITGNLSVVKKIILGVMAAMFLMAMLYSGTRGAYVLLPAALVLLVILKFNRSVMIFSIIAGIFLTFLIFVPTSNVNLVRFQTAFRPSEDASFNLRKNNQKRIQPYIQSHPMGGGLGATGTWGSRFAPNSFLASFPPDSGYVRVAVELGWVGLLLFCVLIYVIIQTGIKNFYSIKHPELKLYCLAATIILFAFHIGNYPQEALVQYPSNINFYLCVALISATKNLDKNNLSFYAPYKNTKP